MFSNFSRHAHLQKKKKKWRKPRGSLGLGNEGGVFGNFVWKGSSLEFVMASEIKCRPPKWAPSNFTQLSSPIMSVRIDPTRPYLWAPHTHSTARPFSL